MAERQGKSIGARRQSGLDAAVLTSIIEASLHHHKAAEDGPE
jgi:hypothetical protein